MWRGAFVLCLCVTSAYSKAVTTKIDEFSQTIVYSGDKAEIERVVKLGEALSAEEYHTVSVHGFTENVMDETIRIASEEDVEVLDVKISTVRTPRANMPEYIELVDKLQGQLKDLRKDYDNNEIEYKRFVNRLNLVSSYVTSTLTPPKVVDVTGVTKIPPSLPLTEVTALLDYQAKEQEQCHSSMQAISAKQVDINGKMDEITKKISNVQSQSDNYPHEDGEVPLPLNRLEKVLTFRIKLSSSKKTEFIVSYMSSTASWSPEYDIRIESKNKQQQTSDGSGAGAVAASAITAGAAAVRDRSYRLEIDYFANVVQNTGENWVDTPLVLSTANPAYLAPPSVQMFAGTGRVSSSKIESQNYRMSKRHSVQAELMADAMPMMAQTSTVASSVPIVPKVMTNAMTATSVVTGDIGASHKFKVMYPVSVESTDLMLRALKPGTEHVDQRHLILVDKLVLSTNLYTFAVPSQKTEGYMVSLSKYELTNKEEAASASSPLLASAKARLHIQGDNIGSVKFNAVQPGEMMKLNLGTDKNIHIETVKVVPKMTKEEEEKSSWFFKDKKKFRVRTEERLTTIRSSYPSGSSDREVLVIVAENLPRSTTDDEVSVELLSSDLRDAIVLDGVLEATTGSRSSLNAKAKSSVGDKLADVAAPTPMDAATVNAATSTDAFIEAIVSRETKATGSNAPYIVYYSKTSSNVYWAMWLKPGQSVTIPFKYKISWPEDHVLTMS